MADGPKEIKVNFPPSLHGGVYANHMAVIHTREEFVMDFIMVAPPAGSVTARVVVSPGHAKRILNALAENVSLYERKYGEIPRAEEPGGPIRIN
ncbi:MAG TPA: DUF3467 domain-containing protein [Syntrophales bacterium]|nr:DUF3467 domain-containing protein [Syntrophales bacterium]HQB31496.1 DUF3467 domain-containing protein [Syntrophales bacterium]HQN79097.1 DUF3467 domain-containing protein [Syntrophales bacterium]HQQ28290.1 DUF3467 domain-containing protein [Syntrophales bacterium]